MVVHNLKVSPTQQKTSTETVTVEVGTYTVVSTILKSINAPAVFQITENNVAAITFKIQGSVVGDATWSDLEDDAGDTEFAILKNGFSYRTVAEPWPYLRCVAKGGGSVTAEVAAS